jgi:hypothetical protein
MQIWSEMRLSRTVAACALALGMVITSATASSAVIYHAVGPFGVINSTNKARCESIRKVHIADGLLTKPCESINGQYYSMSTK